MIAQEAVDLALIDVLPPNQVHLRLGENADVVVMNDYLGYLGDRGYSPRTVRAYAFDLLAFARWLTAEAVTLEQVGTDVLLRFLTFCRGASVPAKS